MPKFALANWLYYGHDELPHDVKHAFADASPVEKVLVSRARASKICMKFSDVPGHELAQTDRRTSQTRIKGNVAIHPQDATHLNDALPPTRDVVKDLVCAIFVSGKTKVTKDNVENLRPAPMLARKSRLQLMIQFLLQRNVNYKVSGEFRGFSQANMDLLFGGDNTTATDEGIPCGIEISTMETNDALEAATDGYVPGVMPVPSETDTDMLLDSVGFVAKDYTHSDYRQMKHRALKHCLEGGRFVQSRAGSQFIPDFQEPGLLSWLFPHLDPWGIGGFFDPRRERPLKLWEQLKYMIMVHGSPCRNDANFSFVFYNVKQKNDVFNSVTFKVPAKRRDQVVRHLMSIDVKSLDALSRKYQINPRYRPENQEEKHITRILSRVTTVACDLPGSNGYKIGLRNQIRALINFIGTPTLFVTLNPSDLNHPLVQLYAGYDVSLEEEMRGEELSEWNRKVTVAKNPAACARFFHTIMSKFIWIILRYNRPGKGLFGKCTGYFGTVEAQGRGTLHCHMLIWLAGHLPPQKLRDTLDQSAEYKRAYIAWAESFIKNTLFPSPFPRKRKQ